MLQSPGLHSSAQVSTRASGEPACQVTNLPCLPTQAAPRTPGSRLTSWPPILDTSLAAGARLFAQIVSGLLPSHCTVSGDLILGLKTMPAQGRTRWPALRRSGARSTPPFRVVLDTLRASSTPVLLVQRSHWLRPLRGLWGYSRHRPSVPRIGSGWSTFSLPLVVSRPLARHSSI